MQAQIACKHEKAAYFTTSIPPNPWATDDTHQAVIDQHALVQWLALHTCRGPLVRAFAEVPGRGNCDLCFGVALSCPALNGMHKCTSMIPRILRQKHPNCKHPNCKRVLFTGVPGDVSDT